MYWNRELVAFAPLAGLLIPRVDRRSIKYRGLNLRGEEWTRRVDPKVGREVGRPLRPFEIRIGDPRARAPSRATTVPVCSGPRSSLPRARATQLAGLSDISARDQRALDARGRGLRASASLREKGWCPKTPVVFELGALTTASRGDGRSREESLTTRRTW